MKNEKKICNYLDIPLQHINSDILKSMRRGHTRQVTEKLLLDLRNSVPDVAIRTTLIVRYPEETQEKYEELKQWVQETRFDRMGVFAYSHEEDTHAEKLEDDVPEATKQNRVAELMEIQAGISFELNQAKVEKVMDCIFDRQKTAYYIGRTQYDSPDVDNEVLVDANTYSLEIGKLVAIKITEATDFDLIGEPV